MVVALLIATPLTAQHTTPTDILVSRQLAAAEGTEALIDGFGVTREIRTL